MKFTFTETELVWLNYMAQKLIVLAGRDETMGAIQRTAQKMRYKFYGKPSYVNLTGKERALIRMVAEKRMESLRNSLAEERNPVASILEKV